MNTQEINLRIWELAAQFVAMSVNIGEQLKRMGGVCR